MQNSPQPHNIANPVESTPALITNLQLEASNPNISCFVSASAGTGKTKVLVDRFLRLILEKKVPPQNILCITYTNTAADEVKARILSKLNSISNAPNAKDKLQEFMPGANPKVFENFNSCYANFVEQYQELKIYTIHSFCYQILQQYWRAKGEPTKQIIEPSAAILGVNTAIDSAIISCKEQALYLLSQYELLYLRNTLKSALNCKSISGYSFKYERPKEDPIQELYNSQLRTHLEEVLGIKFCTPHKMAKELQNIFLTKSGAKRKRVILPKSADQGIKKNALLNLQDIVCEVFERSTEYQFQTLNYHIGILFENVSTKYAKFKEENFVLDFNDILHVTLNILRNDPHAFQVLYQIDLAIDHILIDEAQDTSPVQWEIIKLITTEYYSGLNRRNFLPTLFVVGDFKQSIYSFQGANPQYFLQIKQHFNEVIEGVGGKFKTISFNTSFRSEPTILNYVDKIFAPSALTHAISGGATKVTHIPFKKSHGLVVLNSVVDVDTEGNASNVSESNTPTSIKKQLVQKQETSNDEELARQIGNHIMFHVKHKNKVVGTQNRIQYKDVMVIFRKRSECYYKLIEILNTASVPVSSNRNINLSTSKELQYIKNLIQFVLFPYDDYNLYELLKSPFFNEPNNSITKLFYNRKNAYGFEIARTRAPQLYAQLMQFIEMRNLDVSSFLQKIFIELNYIEKFVKHFGMAFKVLYNKITYSIFRKFEPKVVSLLDFYTKHLENFRAQEEFNNNFEGVKVITAHAAKGLQSKVVILADTTTTDNQPHDLIIENHVTQQLMFIPKKALQPQFVQEYLEQKKLNEYCENLRLLYVATTRAENELHIFGKKSKSIKNSWYQILSDAYKACEEFASRETSINTEISTNINSLQHTQNLINLPSYNYFAYNSDGPTNTKYLGVRLYNKGLQSGGVMHELLHYLPHVNSKHWKHIKSQLVKFSYEFELATKIITKYPEIFYPQHNIKVLSEVEVAVVDYSNGSKKNYIIDKLIVSETQVKIVDFKSDAKVNEGIIEKYRPQLLKYQTIIQGMYPNHKIRSYLLFCHHYDNLHNIV